MAVLHLQPSVIREPKSDPNACEFVAFPSIVGDTSVENAAAQVNEKHRSDSQTAAKLDHWTQLLANRTMDMRLNISVPEAAAAS